jgi:hypothetical protein
VVPLLLKAGCHEVGECLVRGEVAGHCLQEHPPLLAAVLLEGPAAARDVVLVALYQLLRRDLNFLD